MQISIPHFSNVVTQLRQVPRSLHFPQQTKMFFLLLGVTVQPRYL